MALGLRTNDNVVLVSADFAPDDRGRVLGKTAEVDELALGRDLGEGSTVTLANGNELTTVVRSPAPRGGALTTVAAEVGMAQEVNEVEAVAAEGVVGITLNGNSKAIDAGNVREFRVLGGHERAGLSLLVPPSL